MRGCAQTLSQRRRADADVTWQPASQGAECREVALQNYLDKMVNVRAFLLQIRSKMTPRGPCFTGLVICWEPLLGGYGNFKTWGLVGGL